MPSLFTVSGYKVYFWSNEDGELIKPTIAQPSDSKRYERRKMIELSKSWVDYLQMKR